MIKIFISLFLSGLLFGSGPCVAACGPLLISYITGTGKTALKGFLTYIIFSFARISAYVALGISVFFLGRLFLENISSSISKYVFILGGTFIIFIGLLNIVGKRFEPFGFLTRRFLERDKKSIALFGIIIGLLPCPPLVAILSYIGLISKSWLYSFLYSLSFGLGTLISPLILLSIFAGFLPKFVAKKAVYEKIFNAICGLVIIFLGAQLIIRAF